MEPNSALRLSFQRLGHVLDDFRNNAATDTVVGLFGRFVTQFDKEPMQSFLAACLPAANFSSWWVEKNGGRLASSGQRTIDWPADTPTRVALQVDLCRELAAGDTGKAIGFAFHQFNAGRSVIDAFGRMAQSWLAPMLRDLEELAEERPAPAALVAAVRARPRSQDSALDALLDEACTAFVDPAPQSHRRAVERLWDAWERTKTLQGAKKNVSAEAMLDMAAAPGSAFREILGREAKELTSIGNNFHIRHYETNSAPLEDQTHVDYLFHRMLAMLQLVVR